MSKVKNSQENFLEKIPTKNPDINWTSDENGIVTLEIVNKKPFDKLFQLLLKKPKISYIHLDENGSFVWHLIDGKTDIIDLGKAVEAHFGEKSHPLYERLSVYFQTLETNKFISLK